MLNPRKPLGRYYMYPVLKTVFSWYAPICVPLMKQALGQTSKSFERYSLMAAKVD